METKRGQVGDILRLRCLYTWRGLLLAVLLLLLPSTLLAETLPKLIPVRILQIKDAFQASLPSNAKWSVAAFDVHSGQRIISEGNTPGHSLAPASLIKLFVTSAILDLNSKESIPLDTLIAADGIRQGRIEGNAYLKGSGNAFLSEADLNAAADRIGSDGIREIAGDLVADDSLFDISGWKRSWTGPAYALPGALGLDLHTISITVSDNLSGLRISPGNENVAVIGISGDKASVKQIDDLHYEVASAISGTDTVRKRFQLNDPALYAGQTFATILKSKGISIRGTVRKGTTPSKAKVIQAIPSKGLPEMIKLTNINSINVVSDNLLFLLGAKRFGAPGTLEKGTAALREFLIGLGMNPAETAFVDGSGLSSANSISADEMALFLTKAAGRPWFEAFYNSLNRTETMDDKTNLGQPGRIVRFKTGQTPDVYSMAGYVDSGNNRLIAFSCIVNVPGAEILAKENGKMLALFSGMAEERDR